MSPPSSAPELFYAAYGPACIAFDHVVFNVGNAKQAASFYTTRYGFKRVAYRGLETGSRDVASHVVRNGTITLVFESDLQPNPKKETCQELAMHGDAVKVVAFTVTDARKMYEQAIRGGAKPVMAPTVTCDEYGRVVTAIIATYGDVHHSFIERPGYNGVFLPGFKPVSTKLRDPVESVLPPVDLKFIDHVVGNQPANAMNNVCEWYERTLGFHRFWSVDDKAIHSEYSSLRSVVMASENNVIKMPINEPAEGKKKSQIQEYVDFYGGAGVQHIALNCSDIITTVANLKARGVQFLKIADTYYDNLREKLKTHNQIANKPVVEDVDILQELQILVDYDENGYLLQIFTECVEDRPTCFFEIIQRNNHEGFGAGNFKSLFEALEKEQQLRGNLTDMVPEKVPVVAVPAVVVPEPVAASVVAPAIPPKTSNRWRYVASAQQTPKVIPEEIFDEKTDPRKYIRPFHVFKRGLFEKNLFRSTAIPGISRLF